MDRLEHSSGIDLSGMRRYVLLVLAAMVETDLCRIDGRTARIPDSELAAMVDHSRTANKPGGYLITLVYQRLGVASIQWRREADRIAALIGYPSDQLSGTCDPPSLYKDL